MGRITLAWELGGSEGHLAMLTPLIPILRAMHHEVVFVARDVTRAARAVQGMGVTLLASPVWSGRVDHTRPASNLPEVLFRVGYHDPEQLGLLVDSWVTLLRLAGTELLIAEHSPAALIAARILDLPCIVLGTGFSVPPQVTPSPSLSPWTPVNDRQLQQAERRLLLSINPVLEDAGAAPIESLAALYHRRPPILLTYPELDHFGERPGVTYWGVPLQATIRRPRPEWSGGKGEKVFVYLHSRYRLFNGLVQQLQDASDLRSLVVAPGLPGVVAREMSRGGLRVTGQPVDLEAVTRECRVVVNHASHGTLARVLGLGRPLLMLPNYIEQAVLAWRVAERSLGVMPAPDAKTHNYRALIQRLLDSDECFTAAETFAAQVQRKTPAAEALSGYLEAEIKMIL